MAQHNPATPQQLPPRGPCPLPLHLGLASLIWLSWPLLWQRLQQKLTDSKPVWNPALQHEAARLAQASAALPPEEWAAALAAEGMARYRDYLAGVTNYRAATIAAPMQPPSCLNQLEGSRLLDYAPNLTSAPLLLVVPSLVNRATILDLSPERSLLRWLVGQNIRPLLVDWGLPEESKAANLTLESHIARLQHFLHTAQQMAAPAGVHLMGHCLGGNLALALAATNPTAFRSLTLLSTPWDFHAGDGWLGKNAAAIWDGIAQTIPQQNIIPAAVVQSLFALLQPQAVTEKFRRLGRSPPSPAELQHFARVEQWLNDPTPLSRAVMRSLIEDWYGANQPMRGGWRVAGQPVRPRNIKIPTLVAIPDQDHIVPPASSSALARQLPCAQEWHVPLGHIGMIISHKAPSRVWRKLADWVLQHATTTQ